MIKNAEKRLEAERATVEIERITSTTSEKITYTPSPPRGLRGEESPVSKLTREDVIEIRRRLRYTDASVPDLVPDFPISQSGIWKAALGQTWSHVSEEPPLTPSEHELAKLRKSKQ